MNKRPHLILAFLFLYFQFSFAQPSLIWEKNFGSNGNDYLKYTLPTTDGHFLTVGTTKFSNNLDRDIYLSKLAQADGAIVWSKNYLVNQSLSTNYNLILGHETSTAYVIIGAYELSSNRNDIFQIDKATGNFNGAYCSSIGRGATALAPTSQPDVYLVGSTANTGIAQIQIIELEGCNMVETITSPSAAEFWGRTIERIIPTPDGGYLVCGNLDNEPSSCDNTDTDIWTAKLDANYNIVWTRHYGGQSSDELLDAEIKADGGFYILGKTADCEEEAAIIGPQNIGAGDWVMELDDLGNIFQNPVTVSQEFFEETTSVQAFDIDLDGHLLLTGTRTSPTGEDDFIEKIIYQNDQSQNLWSYSFPSETPAAHVTGIEVLDNGQIVCHGYTRNGASDAWLSLLDGDGGDTVFNCTDAQSISCGTILSNENLTSHNFDSSLYDNCYNGTADYSGSDKVYKLEVEDEDQQYKIVLDLEPNNASDIDLFLLNTCTGEMINCQSTTVNEGNAARQILDIVLEMGTYYLIVDSNDNEQSGNYDLSVSCDCMCSEPLNDQPIANKYLGEDFENMGNGLVTAQSTRWRLWDNTATNAASAEVMTDNDNKVLQIQSTDNQQSNIIYDLNDQNEGLYRLSWRMWIAEEATAAYSILHDLPDETGQDAVWAYHVFFGATGEGEVAIGNNEGTAAATFSFERGQWNNISQIINIDENRVELWLNHDFITSWAFDRSSEIGFVSNELAGIQFWGEEGDDYWVDDICMWEALGIGENTPLYDPVCIDNGDQYGTAYEAQCNGLLISPEMNPCFSVCDAGGKFVYRGDVLRDTLSEDNFVPNLILRDTITQTNIQTSNSQPLMDMGMTTNVYIFYNDGFSQEIKPKFISNPDSVHGFVFTCEWTEQNGGSMYYQQKNLGTFEEFSNTDTFYGKGFFYLVVVGMDNSSYDLKVYPPGPCGLNVPVVARDTAFGDNLASVAAPNFNVFNNNGNYQSCYKGTRTYEGESAIYKVKIEQASYFSAQLEAFNTTAGMFLYNFICGGNCIEYTEVPDGGGTTSFDSLFLEAGDYYLVIDSEDESGEAGDFFLNLSSERDANTVFPIFGKEDGFDATCTNPGSVHTVHINENADTIENFLNTNTNIIYTVETSTGEEIPVYSEFWSDPNDFMEFELKEESNLSDEERCSYMTDDELRLRLYSDIDNSAASCEIEYDNDVNNPGLFEPGKTSTITGLTLVDLISFGLTNSIITAPANVNEDNVYEVAVNANIPWQIDTETFSSEWIVVDTTVQDNIIAISIPNDNLTQTPRSGTLRVVFNGPDGFKYYRYIHIQQEGICYKINAEISATPEVSETCEGASIMLTANATNDNQVLDPNVYNYVWSTGDTTQSIMIDSIENGQTYEVTITDKFCVASASNTLTIDAPAAFNVVMKIRDANCGQSNGRIALLIEEELASSDYTYVWSDSTSSPSLLNIPSGNYSVTVTDSNGCSVHQEGTVGNEDGPSFNILTNQCAGNNETYFVIFQTDADLVSHDGSGNLEQDEGNYIIGKITPGENINVTLTYTDIDCSQTYEIIAPNCLCDIPSPQFLSHEEMCEGNEMVALTVEPQDNNLVNWYDTEGSLLASATNGTFMPPSGGIFLARSIDEETGCVSDEETEVRLEVHDMPVGTIIGTNEACYGDEIMLTANIEGDYDTICWSTGVNDLEMMDTIHDNAFYELMIGMGDCQSNAIFGVSIFDPNDWSIVQEREIDCSYYENAVISVQNENGDTPPFVFWDSTQNNQTYLYSLGPGDYVATVQDYNGCEFTLETTITQPEEISFSNMVFTAAGGGDQGEITFDLTGGTPNYDVYLMNTTDVHSAIDSLLNISGEEATFSNLTAGSYFFLVLDANDCRLEAGSSFTINPLISTIDNREEQLDWTIQPNPTTGQVYVELSQTISTSVQLSITNVLGQSVRIPQELPLEETQFELDLSTLAKGVYLVHLKNGKQLLTQKIIVQ